AGFVPSAEVVLVEEAGPEQSEAAGARKPWTSREVRVAFDVDVTRDGAMARPGEEPGLVRAIEEGGEGEVPGVDEGPSRRGWLAAGLFLAALGVGFLLVWLLG
ncbi:MAG TPA: serine/threonine protein kinase, partial [Archangium sp.]|nr:serine/threonine protein kinase [Archangium sp.]